MKTILLCMMLVLVGGALAENVTTTVSQNVTIICTNDSQCVTVVKGQPVLFMGNASTTILSLDWSFSYEPNITIIENVTNVTYTNYTVETHNVTVVQCNESPRAPIDISIRAVSDLLNNSLVASCSSACAVAQEERTSLQSQLANTQGELSVTQNRCNDDTSALKATYEAQLNVTATQLKSAENDVYPWIFICTLLLFLLGVQWWVNYRNSRPPKFANGPVHAPIIEPPKLSPWDKHGIEERRREG